MLFCPANVTFLKPWIGHGLSHCFFETTSSALLFSFIMICGLLQFRIYSKYALRLDTSIYPPPSCLYKLQCYSHFLFIFLVVLRLVLLGFYLYEKELYWFMYLSSFFYVASFCFALKLLSLERQKGLPRIYPRGHGLALLVFWTLAFSIENLTFLNLQKGSWWFSLQSSSDKIEFGLFVVRYVISAFLFFVGLKAPGKPNAADFFSYQEGFNHRDGSVPINNNIRPTTANQSTFAGIRNKVKKLVPFLWPKKSRSLQLRVIFCFCLLILGRVIAVFVPIYNKYIVDSLSMKGLELVFRWDYILIYVFLWFLQGQGNNSLLSNIRSYLWIRVQQYTVKEIELDMYKHLHNLSLNWHLSRKIGEVLRVMDRGTNSISSLLSYIVFNIIPTFADISIAVVFFAVAFNIWFGLIVLVTMVLYLTCTIMVTEWRTKYRRESNRLENEVEAQCVDSLLNFETVKYYSAEDYELNNLGKAIEKFQVAEWKSSATLNMLNTLQNGIISLGVMGGALLCSHYVVEGKLTAGDYVLFSSYILQLYTPLNFFGTYYRMVQTAFVDMENMFTLFDCQPEIVDAIDAAPLKLGNGCIEFKNVNFSYVPERQILHNISFVIPPGRTIALVGPTGSGKSTITRLLFRFYNLSSGEIIIDGQDISKITQQSLRQSIGVVPQDTVLFNKSIRYNIGYGRPSASDAEIEEASRAAEMHNQILTFPDGYDTIVGERGLKLSGGEKQRVAIARTILKNPSFVVLDEATSSLDTQTERNIQQALSSICANRTTLIVAHRLSTIIHADEILVLNQGEIIERGRHNDLLQKNGGFYSAMWQQQLEPEKEEKLITM